MVLLYKAATQDGKIVQGLIEARDMSEAASYLRSHKMLPITISKQTDNPITNLLLFGNKFSSSDLVFFTRQIASMLTSGLTLMQALTVLKNQVHKKAVNDIIQNLVAEIESGNSLSSAMEKNPKSFPPIYISLVKAGEGSGLLDKVMTRLAENLEKEQKLRSQIKSALLYPVIVILMMVAVIFIMMLFVIPQLSSLYESLDIELPLTTQLLVGISKYTVMFWPFLFIGALVFFFLFQKWKKTPLGRKSIDSLLLKLPMIGKLIRLRIMTEFSRTFGLLVGAGGPIVPSLHQTKGVVGNVIYEEAINTMAKRVEKGVNIGDTLETSHLFPPLLVQMVRVGEQTGKLDENLTRASEYFEREVEQMVKTLTTAMEPIIMAVLGLGVAFLLVAVITPIYKLTSSF